MQAAVAQLGRFYNLPVYNSAGITDSKIPDVQAGYEKGITNMAAVLAGANYIHHAAGIVESTLAVAYEQFVIDDDINGSVMRLVRGIEVNEKTLSVDLIDRACQGGEGHFLGEQQTLEMMTTEYYYPHVGDRQTRKKWRADGRLNTAARAAQSQTNPGNPPTTAHPA
jgi:trimethylamine--corrinoid protein Co-methyltransferase